MSPLRALLASGAVLLALSGCTNAPSPAPTTPAPVETVAPSGDGVLRIGALLPASAPAQFAAVQAAAREINAAGGVNGAGIEIHTRNAGDTAATAEAALGELIGLGVDAVVGPASAEIADALNPAGEESGVAVVAPGAYVDEPAEVGDELAAALRREDPGLGGDTAFAAEAYDATVLIALSATLAKDDGGASIAAWMQAAARDGFACTSFGQCVDAVADGQDVAYTGPAGELVLAPAEEE